MLKAQPTLTQYIHDLQAGGRITFTDEEALAALGITRNAFLKASARLQKAKLLLNPRQGFYVAVPAQYASWGAPPPAWYIDALMRHEERPYYVGLLKAAELHGASHQAAMEFQIVTDKQLRDIRAGRSIISFFFRKDFNSVEEFIMPWKTDTGAMKISSPELTALDLLRYPRASGGIDAAATVLSELSDKLDPEKLARAARHFERSVIQRLGYLLDFLGARARAEPMHRYLVSSEPSFLWVPLAPAPRGFEKEAPVERNSRWRVHVHSTPEIDE
jgi:predicted transcriptional regulator of viral defense system